ncbi:hypothetical protein EBB54_20500 [Schaedlerella arabinosiphila]|jgi:hypothetical protein|uniref:Uncharacterized protein n=1 Tax=Schaedlerella arabinosiphila TaxID=2044587 RepID=A0A426DL71_9FIRM|nr:hypothetical protein [Schaedlerella arabinosiphila]RRK33461.1 hypothetical protein EBB54_20500 [Schaedlerella arabinosiphila]
MAEQKRFQNQTLNSEDYQKTESGAQLLKDGGKVLGIVLLGAGVIKKYGPEIIKGINKVRKT